MFNRWLAITHQCAPSDSTSGPDFYIRPAKSNMNPFTTMNNAANTSESNEVKHFVNLRCGHAFAVKISYFKNLNFTEFCAVRSFPKCISLFLCTIGHIILLSSKEQMVRINANRIVAFVASKKSIWDFSIFKSVRKSVGRMISLVEPKVSIATRPQSRSPKPASIFAGGFINAIPEVLNCISFTHVIKAKIARQLGSKARKLIAATKSTDDKISLAFLGSFNAKEILAQ